MSPSSPQASSQQDRGFTRTSWAHQRGPVRDISLKLQEEERERRMDFVPDESALSVESIEVDRDTMDMLKSLNMANLPAVTLQQRSGNRFPGNRKEGGGGNRN